MSTFVADTEAAPGTGFVPVDGPANRGGPPPTEVDACAPFQLVHNPKRWTVLGGRVIPAFGRLPHIPGLNGVDEVLDRHTGNVIRINAGYAKSDAQDRGKVPIPFDAIPAHHVPPGAPKSYLWRPAGRPDVTLLIYTKVFPGSKDVEIDEPRYLEFVDHLVATGVIQPVPLHVLRKMHAQRTSEHNVLLDRAQVVPSVRQLADRAAQDIAAIEAEIERRAAPTETKPATGAGFVPDGEDELPAKAARK